MPSHLCRRVCGSFAAFTAALILVAYAPVAGAATCGDDVGGVRIPCACGDVVVADTRLRSGDPVVTMKCSGDGLLLRAAAEAESLRLDLGGHSLIEEGYGNGVRVIDGGSHGAVIVGAEEGEPGAIANFATGLRALNPRVFTHASTSPNLQIIATLDVARRQMELEGYELVSRAIQLALLPVLEAPLVRLQPEPPPALPASCPAHARVRAHDRQIDVRSPVLVPNRMRIWTAHGSLARMSAASRPSTSPAT